MLVNCDEFAKVYAAEKGPKILLDVREPDEFRAGSISGATNIPVSQLASRINEIGPEKRIFIHCRSGGRAQKAADILKASGFKNIVCATNGGFDQLKTCMY